MRSFQSFIIIMIDEHYYFTKSYKCASKHDDDLFHIKYSLNSQLSGYNKELEVTYDHELPLPDNTHKYKGPAKIKDSNDQKQIQQLKQYSKKKIPLIVQPKKQKIQYVQKETLKEEQNETFNTSQLVKPVKQLNSKRGSKVIYPKEEDFKELVLKSKRSKSTEIVEKPSQIMKKQLNKKPRKSLYENYKPIEEIEQSRRMKQQKYFKGKIQYNEGVKFSTKIISEEYEGRLVAEGKNRNRCLHEQQVYFEILKQEKQKIQCKIVAIACDRQREIVGKIQFQKDKQHYLFNPINKRITTMYVKIDNIEKDWRSDISTKYFLAEFTEWSVDSELPSCHIIDQYGRFGQLDIEAKALLKTHGLIDVQYHQPDIVEDLKKAQQLKANIQNEIHRRVDLRNEYIFLIEENGKNFFDGGVSIKRMNQSSKNPLKCQIFELGVHIVDVDHYVGINGRLQQQIKKRIETIIFPHRTIDMLPESFTSNILSTQVGKDILSVSIFVKIDEQGKVLEGARQQLSIICPKLMLSVNDIQQMMREKDQKSQTIPLNFRKELQTLFKIVQKVKHERTFNDQILFEIPKPIISFDQNFAPKSFQFNFKSETIKIIEEIQNIANQKCAEILIKKYQRNALLFRHRVPKEKRLQQFEDLLKKMGIKKQLCKSSCFLKDIRQIIDEKGLRQSVKNTVIYQLNKLLEVADYYLSAQSEPASWIHCRLNVPIFTHFTHPMNQYADLWVQRCLKSTIEMDRSQSAQLFDSNTLSEVVSICNEKRVSIRRVESGFLKICLCLYFKNYPVLTEAIVTSIETWGVKLCVPKFDFKTTIKYKQKKSLKVLKIDLDQADRKYIKLQYNFGQNNTKFVLKQMQEIEVQLGSTQTFPIDFIVNLVMPHPTIAESSLIIE